MKTRNGFVSNSSSSNFIVLFPSLPTSAEEVLNLMFKHPVGEICLYDTLVLSHEEIARRIFAKAKVAKQIHPDIFNIPETEGRGYSDRQDYYLDLQEVEVDDIPRILFYLRVLWSTLFTGQEATREIDLFHYEVEKTQEKYWTINREDDVALKKLDKQVSLVYDQLEEAQRVAAAEHLKQFLLYRQGFLYTFELADEDNEAVLEHGNIFRRLPHLVQSHH